jgi:hypothetical protein
LSEFEQRRFEHEVLKALRACASAGRFTAFENLIDSWAATAEVGSDPQRARALVVPVATPEGSNAAEPAAF